MLLPSLSKFVSIKNCDLLKLTANLKTKKLQPTFLLGSNTYRMRRLKDMKLLKDNGLFEKDNRGIHPYPKYFFFIQIISTKLCSQNTLKIVSITSSERSGTRFKF